MVLLWLRRLLATRAWRLIGAAAGVGLAVALLGTLGAFLAASFATMTDRAIAGVPVDWQVQIATGGDLRSVEDALATGVHPVLQQRVTYADVAGFSSNSGGSVQTTGPGQVVGLDGTYRHAFPDELRGLVGSLDGALISQQTASNLHARVGDRVDVLRIDKTHVQTVVAGVVDLPYADSFFQAVGVAGARAPRAPPDNVLIISSKFFQQWFAGQADRRPASVRTQLHVRIPRNLPHDPLAALTAVTDVANSVELKSAGAAIVADNLAAKLQGTREDSLYARLLFLFLGLPGAALATIVALVIIASGAEQRRRDAARLRVRGASARDIVRLAGVEAFIVWVIAALIAGAVTAGATRTWTNGAGADPSAAILWTIAGVVVAAVIVAAAHIIPVAMASTAVGDLKIVGRPQAPLWRKVYLDLLLLAVGAAFFAKTAASGYQVVLAPEGVLQSSVSYDAFIGPFLLWLGGGLLVRRLAEAFLASRALLQFSIRPVAGTLAGVVAAAISRQRMIVGRGLTIVALAIAFAVSTATFNETYNAQSRVDAELTNGADVAVTLPNNADGDEAAKELGTIPGTAGVDVMQHRFTYVGQDLQDLFAVDPLAIGKATDMSNAFFGNHDARATLARLASRPDGVLLAEETVRDFQLRDGDRINLRLQSGKDGKYRPIAFTFVGVAREFPMAPKDSFIVANAGYVNRTTGPMGSRIVLLRAGTRGPAALAADARAIVDGLAGARVTDIATAQKMVGSSLTSVDLHGLTNVELAFALLLLAGASGLSLALGFAERRRNFAILAALGATSRQIGAFLWAEAGIVVAGGLCAGAVLGFAVTIMLVKVLTGVFDPPPDALTIPWPYLAALAGLAVLATTAVVNWATIVGGHASPAQSMKAE